MPLTQGYTFDIPGVFLTEDVYGAIPASIANHSAVYMMGLGTRPGCPVNTPTFIQSPDDFTNVFGASASINSIRLFFAQRSGSGIYFISVAPKATNTLTIATVTAGTTYSITIDSYPVTYQATATDTPTTVLAALARLINNTLSHVARMTGNVIRTATGTTVVVGAGITTVTGAAPAYPVAQDVVDSINLSFDSGLRQGFLIAPEFFQSYTSATERQVLALGMQALAADPLYNWVALVDCGQATATQVTGAGAINLALLERNNLNSPKGHTSYFFPYWRDGANNLVPMSATVAGVALRRYRAEGYRQPPAGVKYPVYGVTDTSINITDKIQSQLNPLGVNCGRKLPQGRGTVIYGSRTVSTSPFYKFMATRVIMNVLGRSLMNAYNDIAFNSIDGLGILMLTIKQTAIDVCEAMRRSGALYGATPEEAYLVVCDATNNPSSDLENGLVSVDVVAKPSPILEALSVRVSRSGIGTNLVEITSSADTSGTQRLGGETTSNSATPKAQ